MYTSIVNSLGATLRRLRKEQGLGLKDIANACDVSTSFLSQVERGVCSISISSLEGICDVLGVSLSALFSLAERGEEGAPSIPVEVHSNEAPQVSVSEAQIQYRFLSKDLHSRLFEVVIGEIPAGYFYPPASHDGEEFGFVLRGRLNLTLEDGVRLLETGDSYHLGPYMIHGYEAVGDENVTLLWVQTLRDHMIRSGEPTRTQVAAVPNEFADSD